MSLIKIFTGFTFLFYAVAKHAHRQNGEQWTFSAAQQHKLSSVDGSAGDSFGRSSCICENRMIVGAYEDKFRGVLSGSAYAYYRVGDTWEFDVKLYPSLGEDYDSFGWSTACFGNVTIVGAYSDNYQYTDAGAVYLYYNLAGHWYEGGIFYSSAPHKHEYFGWSVAIHGDLVVVGAYGSSSIYTRGGAAYVFYHSGETASYDDDGYIVQPSGWELDTILLASNAEPYMYFGWDVALDYSSIVVSAPNANSRGGAVYVYDRNVTYHNYYDDIYYYKEVTSYEELDILVSPVETAKSYFGQSVAISHDVIVVGEHMGYSDVRSGLAHIYERKRGSMNWKHEISLSDLQSLPEYALYGFSVAIDGNYVVVSAPGDFGGYEVNSTVFIYERDMRHRHEGHWSLAHVLEQPTPDYCGFGNVVTISNGHVAVSAEYDDMNGEATGSVYVLAGKAIVSSPSVDEDANVTSSRSGWFWLFLLCIPAVFIIGYIVMQRERQKEHEYAGMSSHSIYSASEVDYSESGRDVSVSVWNNPMAWISNEIRLSMDSSRGSSIDSTMASSTSTRRPGVLQWLFTKPQFAPVPTSNMNKKRLIATAQAVAVDDNHPNQEEVAELLRSFERDWISEEKFLAELQRLVF